jgi:tetratricopeptide (TPR) repeat protein
MTRFACAGTTLISWPRILGAGAALLGEPERARALYEQAFESSGRLRNRPELALTHLQLAELLLENGDGTDREEALHHLDFAIAEFREMKMQPSLERALRHKDVLKA